MKNLITIQYCVIILIFAEISLAAIEDLGQHRSKHNEGFCEYEGLLLEIGSSMNIDGKCKRYKCLDDYNMISMK